MVSFVSKRYMSGVSGTESLVVYLSNYLPLCSLWVKRVQISPRLATTSK